VHTLTPHLLTFENVTPFYPFVLFLTLSFSFFPLLHGPLVTFFRTALTFYTSAVSRGYALPLYRGFIFPGFFGCCL